VINKKIEFHNYKDKDSNDYLFVVFMPTEHFHTRFSVRIVGGLELQLGNSQLLKELSNDSHEVTQSEIVVCDQTLHLVELSQVGSIQTLITEHAVNTEIFLGTELLLL
jgi:hypothetical protein